METSNDWTQAGHPVPVLWTMCWPGKLLMDGERQAPGRTRLWWRVGIGTVAALLLLHGVAWWTLTGWMLSDVPAVLAGAAGAGWQVGSASARRAGWPFAASVTFSDVAATRTLGGSALRWTAERLSVSLSAWDPRAILVSADGRQSLVAGGASLPFRAESTVLRVPLSTGPTTLALSRGVAEQARGLRVARVTVAMDGLGGSFAAEGVTISPPPALPFDGPLKLVTRITLGAPFPDAPTPKASAAGWQAAGGTIGVTGFDLVWGPLHATGTADGRLDSTLQPEGQAEIQLTGAAEALDALAASGLVAQGPAAAARGVLGLLTLAGSGKDAAIPISLTKQVLTVARFPILHMPLLDWDQVN